MRAELSCRFCALAPPLSKEKPGQAENTGKFRRHHVTILAGGEYKGLSFSRVPPPTAPVLP